MDIFDVFVDMQATGDRIKQLRKEKHMRVFDLANALGLESEQAIYKWQRGTAMPTLDNLIVLAAVLELRWTLLSFAQMHPQAK